MTDGAYLATSVLFILGIMRLRSPATARSGNQLAALGMLIALAATFLAVMHLPLWLVAGGVLFGGLVGAVSARKVRMTAMPQMVALFNGMGGGAAALVAVGELTRIVSGHAALSPAEAISAQFSVLVGGVSFAGSILAFLKLQEWLTGRPITFRGQTLLNVLLLVLVLALGVFFAISPSRSEGLLFGYAALALALGVGVVLPVGGADMPVVISLLNSLTGLSAAATGFLLQNNVLILAGALVGASGTILTRLMSIAMNRSLANVFLAGVGKASSHADTVAGTVRAGTVEDVAALLAYAAHVIIVPGFGLAVARAQQELRDLAAKLEARGATVKYAIHPVAGRMPGHMNVLLAEANVPYDQLCELAEANPEFPRADVALVVGANDVTNPAARTDPASPLYGMPILNVDQARSVVVLKRSMAPGFAGVDNALYTDPKTVMLFGDAKASLAKLLQAVEEV
jgi:NAD(P) transhydrogenase subunit beta